MSPTSNSLRENSAIKIGVGDIGDIKIETDDQPMPKLGISVPMLPMLPMLPTPNSLRENSTIELNPLHIGNIDHKTEVQQVQNGQAGLIGLTQPMPKEDLCDICKKVKVITGTRSIIP